MKNKNFWNLLQTLFYCEGFATRRKYEKERSIFEKHKVPNIFNKYFINITKRLNITNWKPQKGLIFQNLNTILDTFASHPSVIQINEKTNKDVFSFRHVLPWET